MKKLAISVTSILVVAACNKGPEVNLHNASANEASKSVQQSEMMSSESMVQPGLWESKVNVLEMNVPGIPPQYAGKMKAEMAKQRERSTKHCIKPEDVKKPKQEFFGADKSCSYEHFTMGAGKIDIAMVCKRENLMQTMNMAGTYTPTTYSLDMNMNGSGPQQGVTMKMHVDARRVGECSGKED